MNSEKILLMLAVVGICIATGWVTAWGVKAGLAKIKSDKIRQFIRRDIVGFFAPAIALDRCVDKRSWNYVHQMRVICRYTYRRFRS
jgi:hypothetical protein